MWRCVVAAYHLLLLLLRCPLEHLQLSLDKASSMAPQLLADLYEELEELGASEEEELAAAGAVLEGLGFGLEQRDTPTKQLSGGWRMRVSEARALQPAVCPNGCCYTHSSSAGR